MISPYFEDFNAIHILFCNDDDDLNRYSGGYTEFGNVKILSDISILQLALCSDWYGL